jgi:hypothetical protein
MAGTYFFEQHLLSPFTHTWSFSMTSDDGVGYRKVKIGTGIFLTWIDYRDMDTMCFGCSVPM